MRAFQFAAHAAKAIGPLTGLAIYNAPVSPDGYTREAIVANGQTPAPLIRGNKNDHFSIQVHDLLTNDTMQTPTTIHWHGIDQLHSNWADGVGMVTQCPLVPGETFNYNWAARDQAGTYWYHSHWTTQYCDGLRGPLVIYDPDDPHKHLYDVDNENTVITVPDWYHISPQLGGRTSNATLINGIGRYMNGPNVTLATIYVQKSKRYRFRLVSLSCAPNYEFSIDEHLMTIIEVDGNSVTPLVVSSIQIFAGQRYSIVIDADQTVDNYCVIRAIPKSETTYTGTSIDGGRNAAIMRYHGAPDEDPTSEPFWFDWPLEEEQLHALNNPVPTTVDLALTLQIEVNYNPFYFQVNGTTYNASKVPVLLQILSGAYTAQDLLPAGSVYELPGGNKTIELTVIPPVHNSGDPHPLHLHGHDFWVVRSGGRPESKSNFINPVSRDVVSLGPTGGTGATIRFLTNNPGPWFLHCHIDFHLDAGFAAVLAVAPEETYHDIEPVPYDWWNLCPTYYQHLYNTSESSPTAESPEASICECATL